MHSCKLIRMIRFYVVYFGLAFLTAVLFALLEIQIEGKNGWAGKLPTWRRKNRFIRWILGNKEFTGYHFYLWLFIFSLLHITLIFLEWSLKKELILISFYILLLRLEDFFWFVLNPDYGIKKFKKEFIPWHSSWIGPLPVSYYLSFLIWIVLFIIGIKI